MQQRTICSHCFHGSPSATGVFCNCIGIPINQDIPVKSCLMFSECNTVEQDILRRATGF